MLIMQTMLNVPKITLTRHAEIAVKSDAYDPDPKYLDSYKCFVRQAQTVLQHIQLWKKHNTVNTASKRQTVVVQ